MTSKDIEFVNTGGVDIKSELDIKLEESNENLPPDLEELFCKSSKCGDVFVFEDGKFTFCCYFCRDKFINYDEFTTHIQKDHSILFKQLDVGLPFEQCEENLEAEEMEQKIDPNYFENNSLYSEESSESSMEDETNFPEVKTFERDCTQCGKTLYSRSGYRRHVKNHTNCDPEKMKMANFQCEVCGKKLYTRSGMRRHRVKYHPEYVATKKLKKTKRGIKVEAQVDKEKEPIEDNQQPTDKGPRSRYRKVQKSAELLKCQFCKRTFKIISHLKIHEMRHTGETPFKCTVCSKAFPMRYLLNMHMPVHDDTKRFKCDQCDLTFCKKEFVSRHIRRVHLGEKKYACDFCDKKFFRSASRIIHMRIHTGEKPYQCEACGENFNSSSALGSHKKRHHIKNKKFGCSLCDMKFVSSSCLKQHMAKHSDERPIECEICQATFSRRRALRHHMKLHSDVKEYVCKICGKEFRQSPGLYSHMKTHGVAKQKKAEGK